MCRGHGQILEYRVIVLPLLLKHIMRGPDGARTRIQLRAENLHFLSLLLAAHFGFGARSHVGLPQKPSVFAYTAPAARALSFLDCTEARDLFNKKKRAPRS